MTDLHSLGRESISSTFMACSLPSNIDERKSDAQRADHHVCGRISFMAAGVRFSTAIQHWKLVPLYESFGGRR